MIRKNYFTIWRAGKCLVNTFNIPNADLALFRFRLLRYGMNILNDVDMIGPHDIQISRERHLACCCYVVTCDMPRKAWELVK